MIGRWAFAVSLGSAFVGLLILAGCKSSSTKESESDNLPDGAPNAFQLRAAKDNSKNNLKQLAIAMHNYENIFRKLPTAGMVVDKSTKMPAVPHDVYSWRVKLLPYIEQDNLYKLIPMFTPLAPIPESVANTTVKTYMNPLQTKPTNQTCYRVFVGNGALFDRQNPVGLTNISDGTANTIMIVEAAEPTSWSSPVDFDFDPNKPLPKLGIFPDGFHAAMADGSIRWIPAKTDEKTIKAMITRAGGEVVQVP